MKVLSQSTNINVYYYMMQKQNKKIRNKQILKLDFKIMVTIFHIIFLMILNVYIYEEKKTFKKKNKNLQVIQILIISKF